ncbi:hypothetical protein [Sphingobacterium sp.]|uniref:hypothetical protein n=1 Tax=Sphingobacterium sp. TaxID=341027 RepID=UPI002FDA00F7
MKKLSILDYLNKMIKKELIRDMYTHMQYPTAISNTPGMMVKEIGLGTAIVEIDTKKEQHSNQQGTIHGGLICELADAAIGTAHSTLSRQANPLPVWN